MTETEWLASQDPQAMLRLTTEGPHPSSHARRPSDRKLRLFACGCARQAWGLLTEQRSRKAVEVAERFADGHTTRDTLSEALRLSLNAQQDVWSDRKGDWPQWGASLFACMACNGLGPLSGYYGPNHRHLIQGVSPITQASLLRCIIGNPWRPLTTAQVFPLLRPEWRFDLPAVRMAQAIYDDRDFSEAALSAMHDALLEAGCPEDRECDDVDGALSDKCPSCGGTGRIPNPILAHLRGPGLHGRGCFAIDVILGKE